MFSVGFFQFPVALSASATWLAEFESLFKMKERVTMIVLQILGYVLHGCDEPELCVGVCPPMMMNFYCCEKHDKTNWFNSGWGTRQTKVEHNKGKTT